MEASLHHIQKPNIFPSPPPHKTKPASIPSQLTQPRHVRPNRLNKKVAVAAESNCGSVPECGSCWGSVSELERELEAEMNREGDEWIGTGRWRDKCGGRGVVELLECLEREAIMGEDQGRDPTDYNRRAQIFDKSSRVFQALKELNHSAPSDQS
ncbi:hypothetical protein L1049_012054 [Liquidambar formosana]|uniref:Uncharacterized protein n=1 Tax=Liquidambar formosana TaxID=63359 RepID=A0AAP0RSE0_LIQFO